MSDRALDFMSSFPYEAWHACAVARLQCASELVGDEPYIVANSAVNPGFRSQLFPSLDR